MDSQCLLTNAHVEQCHILMESHRYSQISSAVISNVHIFPMLRTKQVYVAQVQRMW